MHKALLTGITVIILMLAATAGLAQEAQNSPTASRIDVIINSDEIVIDDTRYRIATGAAFLASNEETPLSFSSFSEGDAVGYSLNADGEIEALWKSAER